MKTQPGLTMIIGGAASGKSAFAEQLAREWAAKRDCELWYLATAQAFDDEMRAKIAKHRLRRESEGWCAIEEPLHAADKLGALTEGVVLLDCATLWLSNHMMAENDLDAEADHLLHSLSDTSSKHMSIVVTNEVGQGIVPEHAMARRFREAQGGLNQRLAAQAELVVQVVAGLPNILKGVLP